MNTYSTAGTGLAAPIDLRLFIEGIEVPVIGADISIAIGRPAEATIQIVPSDEALLLLPRSVVHLFFLDSEAHHAEQRPALSDWDYKILFAGELFSYSFNKSGAGGRAITLSCLDFSNIWDTTFTYLLRYGGGEPAPSGESDIVGNKQVFFGAGAGLDNPFDDIINSPEVVIQQFARRGPYNPNLGVGQEILGGLLAVLELIGGVHGKFFGLNAFNSITERRVRLTDSIVSDTGATAKEMFNQQMFADWLQARCGMAGSVVSFREIINVILSYIYYDYVPNPICLYNAGDGGSARPRIQKTRDDGTTYYEDGCPFITEHTNLPGRVLVDYGMNQALSSDHTGYFSDSEEFAEAGLMNTAFFSLVAQLLEDCREHTITAAISDGYRSVEDRVGVNNAVSGATGSDLADLVAAEQRSRQESASSGDLPNLAHDWGFAADIIPGTSPSLGYVAGKWTDTTDPSYQPHTGSNPGTDFSGPFQRLRALRYYSGIWAQSHFGVKARTDASIASGKGGYIASREAFTSLVWGFTSAGSTTGGMAYTANTAWETVYPDMTLDAAKQKYHEDMDILEIYCHFWKFMGDKIESDYPDLYWGGENGFSGKDPDPILKIYGIEGYDPVHVQLRDWKTAAKAFGLQDIVDAQTGDASTGSTRKEREHINAHIFRPNVWFAAPPSCNVIFPDQYDNFSYSRDMLRETTRLQLDTFNQFYESRITNQYYFAPQFQDSENLEIGGIGSAARAVLYPHERFSGIIPRMERLSELAFYAKLSVEQNQELATGTETTPGEYPNGEVTNLIERYASNVAHYNLLLNRYMARSASVTGRFMPHLVCGFPAVVIDRPVGSQALQNWMTARQRGDDTGRLPERPVHFLGMIGSIGHHFGQDGCRTNLQLSYVRSHKTGDGTDDFFSEMVQANGLFLTSQTEDAPVLKKQYVFDGYLADFSDVICETVPSGTDEVVWAQLDGGYGLPTQAMHAYESCSVAVDDGHNHWISDWLFSGAIYASALSEDNVGAALLHIGDETGTAADTSTAQGSYTEYPVRRNGGIGWVFYHYEWSLTNADYRRAGNDPSSPAFGCYPTTLKEATANYVHASTLTWSEEDAHRSDAQAVIATRYLTNRPTLYQQYEIDEILEKGPSASVPAGGYETRAGGSHTPDATVQIGSELHRARFVDFGDRVVFEVVLSTSVQYARVAAVSTATSGEGVPVEESLRPPWVDGAYANESVGTDIYDPFFGCTSIIDRIKSESTYGALTSHSVEQAVDQLCYDYSFASKSGTDAQAARGLIRKITNRPVASLPEMLWPKNYEVASGDDVKNTGGFYSNAVCGLNYESFGSALEYLDLVDLDMPALFSMSTANMDRIDNEEALELDPRAARAKRVRAYLRSIGGSTSLKSKGILAGGWMDWTNLVNKGVRG